MASGPRSCRLFRETGCWGGWKRESGNEFANAFVLPKSACCLTKATTEKIKGCVLLLISQHLSLKSFGLQEEIPKLWWWFRFRLWKRMWVKQSAVWILPSVSEQWSLAKPRNEPWKVDDRTQSLDLPACYHEKKFLQCSSLACRVQKIAEVLNYSLHRT